MFPIHTPSILHAVCRWVLVHYGPSAGAGSPWHRYHHMGRYSSNMGVVAITGVVDGEDESKRIKEAEGKSSSKSV